MNNKDKTEQDLLAEVTAYQERVRVLEASLAESRRIIEVYKEGEERFREMFEAAPDGYYLNDLKGVFIDGNRAAEKIIGYRKEELIGKSYLSLNLLPLGELLKAAKLLAKNAIGMRTGPDVFTLNRKDKSKVVVEISTVPVKLQGRTVILGIARNISERVRAEEEQRRLQAQLLHAQKMESVGQLAGGIAHEFNNSITAIRCYAELALMRRSGNEPIEHYIDHILSVAEKANNLIKGLLTFSRKPEHEQQSCDLAEIVGNVKNILSRIIGDDIRLDIVLKGRELSVQADPAQLEQVLVNLATNARDAMDHGGEITIETGRTEIDAAFILANGFGRPGPYVTIEFSDTGKGMDEKTRERIFEPFFTTKAADRGTGLGLSMVSAIVQRHNGFIKVESVLGKGSKFTLYFPHEKAVPKAQEIIEAEQALRGGTETILLVEDNDDIREPSRDVLLQFGYAVIEASDGQQAIDLLREHSRRIDLIVTDLVMPKKNGSDVLKEAANIRPGLPSLIISGYPGRVMDLKDFNLEEINFIQKPFSPGVLVSKVRDVLDRSSAGPKL